MIKYRVNKFFWCSNLIEPVQVSKENAINVWVNGHKHQKHSQGTIYFDTFNEAKTFLMKHAEDALCSAQKFYKRVKSLKEDNS